MRATYQVEGSLHKHFHPRRSATNDGKPSHSEQADVGFLDRDGSNFRKMPFQKDRDDRDRPDCVELVGATPKATVERAVAKEMDRVATVW